MLVPFAIGQEGAVTFVARGHLGMIDTDDTHAYGL
jgi:hypothetical protein